jgi:mannose-6-phosphate isomerase-like protein (cupin superfamily)
MASREGKVQTEGVENAAPEAASRTFAVGRDEGEARWWMGGLATIKATAEQTGGRYTLVEVLVPKFPMEENLLHVHHFEDEGFYILEGEMTFYVGEQTIKARSGSYLFGPKDIPTPSLSTRALRGCCSSSCPPAWRASSGRWESRRGR